jgi:glycosyltransferase involved in cell wall biosynthesis
MKKNQQFSEVGENDVQDLVCFSHLRWDFVYQRPQHLMSRFAKQYRVFFIEEPVYHKGPDSCSVLLSDEKVWIVKPVLQEQAPSALSVVSRQKILLNQFFKDKKIQKYIAWYYTPMALKFSSHLSPQIVVYDCMDELSAFKFAPAEIKIMEAELFKKAHVVFTGGHNLYKAKKHAHHNIYPFPSSIDKEHFFQARKKIQDPADQEKIPHIRFGFYGVIDERFDINLVREVAERRPDWQFILVGPVVKINPADLPQRDNIHYLGSKSYKELPYYLSGWDISMIPFEKNESTKYISPTKTPEYLAAGKPVISTSIADVVTPYGDKNLVYIADSADEFIAAAETELSKTVGQYQKWLNEVDSFLKNVSWDHTSHEMYGRINECLLQKADLSGAALKSVA